MASVNSVSSLTLDLPPSCIAFCPTQPQYFVVGTYFLHPKDHGKSAVSNAQPAADEDIVVSDGAQQRSGSLILYRLGGDEIIHVATETTPNYAILDIEWAPPNGRDSPLLALATSTGSLAFYQLTTAPKLVFIEEKQICDPSILVLDLVWHPTQAGVLGVTLSDGRVCTCKAPTFEPTEVTQHDLEAWTLAFAPDSDTIFSGGDDLTLRHPAWQDRKLHQAGITAILPLTADLIVTGSYDDHIRLISIPQVGRRTVLAEENLGGGVWRLKLLSSSSALPSETGSSSRSSLVILASCMHAGARVLRLSRAEGDWKFEVLAKSEEHESMNYGSDVQPGTRDGRKTIVSTSFYDKLLCLWRVNVGAP